MLAPLLEQTVNYLLSIDPDINTQLLEGKLIALTISNTPIRWLVLMRHHRISILSQIEQENYDLDMVIQTSALSKLFKKESVKDLLKSDDIQIIGDVKVAQALLDFVTDLDINSQEVVAYYTNDTTANVVDKGIGLIKKNPPPQAVVNFAKQGLSKLGQWVR